MNSSSGPLVTIIALCYQHERFVEEALSSLLEQTYANIEIIVVDDASTDDSVARIVSFLKQQKNLPFTVQTLFQDKNIGNCAAFNRGLNQAQGKYIIDFATDDLMLPNRIAEQVAYFETLPNDYGVVFTEAEYIDEAGNHLWFHYRERMRHLRPPPTGEVYANLLARYFISSPTMMVRRQVFDALHGYDEQLSYEDFDFWVRSSRNWKYAYLDQCTTQVRKHPSSMSTGWYQPGDPQLHSTYVVCRKAYRLNRTRRERAALAYRLLYETKQAVRSRQWREARLFFRLLGELAYDAMKLSRVG